MEHVENQGFHPDFEIDSTKPKHPNEVTLPEEEIEITKEKIQEVNEKINTLQKEIEKKIEGLQKLGGLTVNLEGLKDVFSETISRIKETRAEINKLHSEKTIQKRYLEMLREELRWLDDCVEELNDELLTLRPHIEN